jgi:TrmH family RNA methyltransferase
VTPPIITSTSNDRVKEARRLRTRKARRSAGRSIAEGPHVLDAMVDASIRIAHVLATADDTASAEAAQRHRFDLVTVSPEVLAWASDTRTPRGPIVVFDVPDAVPPRHHDQVVLHGIADPGNLGAIMRTAVAFGWDVTLSGRTADPWSPKVIRASAGAVFGARLSRSVRVDTLADIGVTTVATVVSGGERPGRPDARPIALLIGAEAGGLPMEVVAGAELRWTIPMGKGTESLNAAVAAGILMYACTGDVGLGVPNDV